MQKYLDELKALVLQALSETECKVVLFGSRAIKTNRPGSDVDIAVLAKADEDLPFILSNIRHEIQQSNTPFKVDLIDLNKTSQGFTNEVMKDGILWKD